MATYEYANAQARQCDQVSGRSDSMKQHVGKATFHTMTKSTGTAATYRDSSHILL
jgi:hypothetical protein